MRSSFTPCDNSTSIAFMQEPPVAYVSAVIGRAQYLPSMGSSKSTKRSEMSSGSLAY